MQRSGVAPARNQRARRALPASRVESNAETTCPQPTVASERIRAVVPRHALDREAAGWALALIAETNLQRSKDLRHVIDDAAWVQLGLRIGDASEMDERVFQTTLERHARAYGKPWRQSGRHVLTKNLDVLGRLLGLTPAELAVLRLAVIKAIYPVVDAVLMQCAKLGPSCLYSAMHRITGHGKHELRAALQPSQSQLCQSELIDAQAYHEPRSFDARADLPGLLTSARLDMATIVRGVVRESPLPGLSKEDFGHLEGETETLLPFLSAALRTGRRGTNILVHGEPGVGKTEYIRWLARELGVALLEVPIESSDGDSLDGLSRMSRLSICQRVAESRAPSMVLFDEIEDAFAQEALRGGRRFSKAWINEQLEHNAVPTLWLCNRTGGIDPAHLRRFDVVIEMRAPTRSHRRRIAEEAFRGSAVADSTLDAIAAHADLTPAHVKRMAAVVSSLPELASEDLACRVERMAAARLEVSGKRWQGNPISLPPSYRTGFVNADQDLDELVADLQRRPSGRLCLYGPPGTGKSAFGRHLADALGRPLLFKRASDLLSKWLGETEQNVAAAFREAADEGAVLLIDEVDSFLQDRQRSRQRWEVTQVNELLTQMEGFDGVLVMTTNAMDALDQASLRRFDRKIRFDWLRADQVYGMFTDLVMRFDTEARVVAGGVRNSLSRLDRLTPGDFAVVRRRLERKAGTVDAALLLSLLREEMNFKTGLEQRRIGFV